MKAIFFIGKLFLVMVFFSVEPACMHVDKR